MAGSAGTTSPSIWTRPALWWRIGIVLAGAYGLSFMPSSLVYFTVQCNVIVFGYFVGTLYWMLRGGAVVTPAPRLRGAITLWILITGLVAHVLLTDGANPLPGLVAAPDLYLEWATFAVHYVVPVMVLVDWLAFVPRQRVSWAILPLWLSYPLLYAVLAEVRAVAYPEFATPYPYYFLDPTTHGYGWVAGQFLLLAVEFAVLGALLILLDRLAGRVRPAARRDITPNVPDDTAGVHRAILEDPTGRTGSAPPLALQPRPGEAGVRTSEARQAHGGSAS